MANFFQPGQAEEDVNKTLSPADQAMKKFKAELLGRLLNASAGTSPTFASYAGGGAATRSLPGGLGDLTGPLLQAMNQPGAFTSVQHETLQPPSTSAFSDLTQLGMLGLMAYKALFGQGGDALSSGGQNPTQTNALQALGLGGLNPALGDYTPTYDPALGGEAGFGPYGSSSDLIPGGGGVPVPGDYPTDYGDSGGMDLLNALLSY